MPIDGPVAVRVVLRTARREPVKSGTDASPGRAVHTNTFLRRAENDRHTPKARLCRQSETSSATTAADGIGSDLSETATVGASTRSSDLSLSPAQRHHH